MDDAQSKVETFALATDIAGGVTAACAITTLILFVASPGSKDEGRADKHAGTSRGVRVAPGLGTLRGSF